MLTNLVQKIQPIIMSTIEWINAHQKLFEVLTLVVAGLGGFLLVGGKILTTLGGMVTALPNVIKGVHGMNKAFMSLLANPITLVIAGIAAAVIGLIAAFNKWHKTEEEGRKFLDEYNQVVNNQKTNFQNLEKQVKQSTTGIGQAMETLKSGVSTSLKTIGKAFSDVWDKMFHKDLLAGLKESLGKLSDEEKRYQKQLQEQYKKTEFIALQTIAERRMAFVKQLNEEEQLTYYSMKAQGKAWEQVRDKVNQDRAIMMRQLNDSQRKTLDQMIKDGKDFWDAWNTVTKQSMKETGEAVTVMTEEQEKAYEEALKRRLEATREVEEQIYKLTHSEYENALYDLNKEMEAYKEAGVDKVKITELYNLKLQELNKETFENSIDNITKLDKTLKDFSENVVKDVFLKNWENAKNTLQEILESININFSENFLSLTQKITDLDKKFKSFSVEGITALITGFANLGQALSGFSELNWTEIIKNDLVSLIVFMNLQLKEIINLFKMINTEAFEGMSKVVNSIVEAINANWDKLNKSITDLVNLIVTLQGLGYLELNYKNLLWGLSDLQLVIQALKSFSIDENTINDLNRSMKRLNDAFKDFEIENVNKALGELKSFVEAIQEFPKIAHISGFISDVNLLVLKLGDLGKALSVVATGWKYDDIKKLGDTLLKLDSSMREFETSAIVNGIKGITEIYNALLLLPKIDSSVIKANMNNFIDVLFDLCESLKTVEGYKINKLADNLKLTLGQLNETFKDIGLNNIVKFMEDFDKLIASLSLRTTSNTRINTGLLTKALKDFVDDLIRFTEELNRLLSPETLGNIAVQGAKSQLQILAEGLQNTLGELGRVFENVKFDSLLKFLNDWEDLNKKLTEMKPIDTTKLTSNLIKMINSLRYLVNMLKQWMYGNESFEPIAKPDSGGIIGGIVGGIIGGNKDINKRITQIAPLTWFDQLEQDFENTIGRIGKLFEKLGESLKTIFQNWNEDMGEVGTLKDIFKDMINQSIQDLNSLADNPLWEQIILKLGNLKNSIVDTVNEIKTSLSGLNDFMNIIFEKMNTSVQKGIENLIKTIKEKCSDLRSALIELKEAFTISGVNDEINKFVTNLEKIPEKLTNMIPALIKFSTLFKDFTFLMVYLLQLMENQVNKLADAINELRDEAYSLIGLVETLTEKILGIFESIKQSEAIREMFGNQNPGSYQNEWEKMKDLYEKIPYIPVPVPPTPPGLPGPEWKTEGLEQIIINGDLNVSGVQNIDDLLKQIKRQSSVRGNTYVGL